jgi:hypothetical protein
MMNPQHKEGGKLMKRSRVLGLAMLLLAVALAAAPAANARVLKCDLPGEQCDGSVQVGEGSP